MGGVPWGILVLGYGLYSKKIRIPPPPPYHPFPAGHSQVLRGHSLTVVILCHTMELLRQRESTRGPY